MKLHIGVDSRSKLIHSVATLTVQQLRQHFGVMQHWPAWENRVWGDQAYRGQREVIRQHAPRALDFTNRRYRHCGVVDEVER